MKTKDSHDQKMIPRIPCLKILELKFINITKLKSLPIFSSAFSASSAVKFPVNAAKSHDEINFRPF